MNLQLLPIGDVDRGLMEQLRAGLGGVFQAPAEFVPSSFGPEVSFHAERQQYHSSELLTYMQERISSRTWRLLGVTTADLYIPILTFVFGEAQLGGKCAIVSTHRLRQEFYGLPPDPRLLEERLLKEAVHELGHTLALTHCQDYACVMAASHAVEWIDIKEAQLCQRCFNKAETLAANLP